MRSALIEGIPVFMDDTGEWICPDPDLLANLKRHQAGFMETYSPALGDPQALVFHAAVDLYQAKVIIDTLPKEPDNTRTY